MKKEINPAIAVAVIAAVVAVGGLILWRTTAGRSPSEGRLQSDLDMSKMEKDPAKFKEGVDDLLRRDRAAHGGKP